MSGDALAAIAIEAGATLESSSGSEARFALASDDASARLLKCLVLAGIPVAEAIPEESRLERLFMGPSAQAPS